MRDLSLYIMDIVQNSIRAKATFIKISMNESKNDKKIEIKISDNGHGMSDEQLQNALDPFFTTRTTRKVGMGLSLLKMAAEQSKGQLILNSQVGVGTQLKVWFSSDHPDCPPIGDISGTIKQLICGNPTIDFEYLHNRNNRSFEITSKQLVEVLDGISLSDVKVSKLIGELIHENIENL